ncbi:MAG: TerD family protein [Prevotella sp.]|jgi:stress response protein SCP2|nr:TerD family protein [Prevotella sp.]
MAFQKQIIAIDPYKYDISKITIGLGWKMKEKNRSFMNRFIFDDDENFDLDTIAFLMDRNDKVVNLGKDMPLTGGRSVPFQKSDIIYYHNLTAPSGNIGAYYNLNGKKLERKIQTFIEQGEYIIHTGDNLVGNASDEDADAEQIIVMLEKLPRRIKKILFLVTIHNGIHRKQDFDSIENLHIRAIDGLGKEIVKFTFARNSDFANMHTLCFGELFYDEGKWYLQTNITFFESDKFVDILKKYTSGNTTE